MSLNNLKSENDTRRDLANYELIDLNRNKVSSENLKTSEGRIADSNGLTFKNGEKHQMNTEDAFSFDEKLQQRIDHVNDKNLKKTNLNPFLSEPDSNNEKVLQAEGSIPSPREDDNTRDACYACDACTQTDKRDACCVM